VSLKAFVVAIPAHTVPADPPVASWARFEIPEHERIVTGLDEDHAKLVAAQQAHIVAGAPAWRPYLRETVALCSARRTMTSFERELEHVRGGRR